MGASLRKPWSVAILPLLIVLVTANSVWGHAKDESYIWLNPQADCYDGQVELRLPDLRKYLGLEISGDDYAQLRESVKGLSAELEAYVRKHFELKTLDGEPVEYEIVKIDLRDNPYFEHFAQIFFKTKTFEKVPEKLIVKSTLLFEHDNYSRSLLCMSYNHFKGESYPERFHHAVFSPNNNEQEVDLANAEMLKAGYAYYLWEGIRHIWIGLDHILFLVTLLLASVLVKRSWTEPASEKLAEGESSSEGTTESADEPDKQDATSSESTWVPVEGFGGAFWNIFKIVTIFTIAHSITLCLASLDIITMPSQLVESIIALSIILVAINNIIPTFRDRTWVILFLFGLFHGLGFASVMQNLPFRMPNLNSLLICFNIGVELGQIVIVAAVFPVIYLLRKSSMYQPVVLIGGSLVICLIAANWFIERAFEVTLVDLPF